jgi:glycine oxidase
VASKPAPEVVVVGAGIVGCAVAYRLAQRGVSVALLEHARPGAEASSAAAGILMPEAQPGADPDLVRWWIAGLRGYSAFVREVGEESGIAVEARFPGRGLVTLTDEGVEDLRQHAARQRAAGIAVDVLDGDEARRAVPYLSESVRAAAFFPGQGQVDNPRLVEAVALAARRAGARIVSGCSVRSVVVQGGRAVGVDLGGERLGADAVVVAAGAWTRFLAEDGVVPVGPAKGQILALMPSDHLPRHIVTTGSCVIASRGDGRVVVGSTVETAGYDKAVTAEGVLTLLQQALLVVPGLRSARLDSVWTGLRPVAPDGLPVIGRGGVEGLWYASGHFKKGILLGPLTGDVVADLVLGSTPPLPVAAFDPRRHIVPGEATQAPPRRRQP